MLFQTLSLIYFIWNINHHPDHLFFAVNRYASSFYGPFREALDSNPRFGDKKTYVHVFSLTKTYFHISQFIVDADFAHKLGWLGKKKLSDEPSKLQRGFD